ncbi:hypothetical protein NSU_3684 [Novosphingobium pentaromativorans US6-1]|uniref:Uncharacterized protein n=1 Tax=Novosphingobium pentaromativorans US6-1 TaxID=1088721 RepID=G6EH62_9SPHN|nr:hypothetical protein NSU_3684 [Novosphingobium pentaromativorans US6-1]
MAAQARPPVHVDHAEYADDPGDGDGIMTQDDVRAVPVRWTRFMHSLGSSIQFRFSTFGKKDSRARSSIYIGHGARKFR